jgi:sodium/bile acid cotransporter 7
VLAFFRRNWFLIALAALFGLGFFAHARLKPLADAAWIRTYTVALAMFLMALPLQGSAIWNALRRPWATLLAVAVTFGLLPLIAWGVSFGLSPELKGGLLVAAVTPCTMASATVWTRKAGGNDTAATVVTVVTNLVCFLVTPVWMYLMTGESNRQSLGDVGKMVLQLLLTVVLPVVVAQALRMRPVVAQFATRRKDALGLASQWCILLMVLIGAINTGEQLGGEESHGATLLNLAAMIVAVLFVHVTSFWLGYFLAKGLGLRWGDQVAVAFAGSQKTLMVGMNVSMGAGFSVLPMVTYHIGQLFIDTILADWLKKRQPEKTAKSDWP